MWGRCSAEQVRAFYAAFDGVTSLRRATIVQFTRIADAIGEDELIGFGLYGSDQEAAPGEWRCLSRRNALRIADEIQVLQGVAGESDQETHLPAAIDSEAGARLFKQRHDRGAAGSDQAKWAGFVRAIESNLGNRISRLENEVESHSGMIRDLRESSAVTEESFPKPADDGGKVLRAGYARAGESGSPRLSYWRSAAYCSASCAARSLSPELQTLAASAIVAAGIGIAALYLWPSKQAATT